MEISDVICKVGGKDKFFDFRSALVPAKSEDYAMLHGCGGSKHAPKSGIRMCITDYSAGTGDKSLFVQANIPIHIADAMLQVCRYNAVQHVDGVSALAPAVNTIADMVRKLQVCLFTGISRCVTACGNIVNGKAHEKGNVAEFGQAILGAKKAATQPSGLQPVAVEPSYGEYNYHQERVNTHKADPKDGFVAVSIVDITRKQNTEKGEAKRYPWTVKIKNMWAAPVTHQNGTTSYSSSNVRDAVECFVQVSDDDMYRCCLAVEHFVSVWENAVTLPMVVRALQTKEQAAQNRRN